MDRGRRLRSRRRIPGPVRADDRGVFAILDRALPSRLLTAFPEGVPIARIPLVEAAETTARFLENAT
jgi:ATP-dependent DNA helicase DinG